MTALGDEPGLPGRLARAFADRYVLAAAIGSGGMADVYAATESGSGTPVAIKVLRPEAADLVGTERFLREVRIAASLEHPGVLAILDSGEVEGLPYYVMPRVAGGSLRDCLRAGGPLPIEDAIAIALQVAEALAYAHEREILHRDIKPANILLDGDRALLADFGVARAFTEVDDASLTRSGVAVGTPGYMSPEQATAAEIDHRSDLYSLACVLHEMLAGEPLFHGTTLQAIIAKHVAVAPTPIRALRLSVPERLQDALLRALDKTPVDRFSTLADFADALRASGAPLSLHRRAWRAARSAVREHPVVTVLILAALGAGGVQVAGAFGADAVSWEGAGSPVLVLPYELPTSTDTDRAAAERVAREITSELHRWDDVAGVSDVVLAGARAELGIDDRTLRRAREGVALARSADARAVVAVTATTRGDSLKTEVSLFEADGGRRAAESIRSTVSALRPRDAAVPVVARLLGLGDAPDPGRALAAGTRNAAAARELLAGLRALDGRRLEEAEARFRRAIAQDSTFALAQSQLAETLFWRASLGGGPLSRAGGRLGSEITRWSTAAMGHLAGLSPTNALRVRAFYAFQLGDLEAARTLYDSLLVTEPRDVGTMLMLANVEVHDPWTVPTSDGRLAPRGSLDRAWTLITRAVRLEPTRELGYGQLFGIQELLDNPLVLGSCPSLEPFAGEHRSPWQGWRPSDAASSFCPVVLDSITWLPRDDFVATDLAELRVGADRLFRQSLRALERWAAFSPDEPQPLDALSEALLARRERLGAGAPERLRDLGAEALGHAARALSLRTDTTTAQLARLAGIHLAAGQWGRAVEVAGMAAAWDARADSTEPTPPPQALLNGLVVGGQPTLGLRVAEHFGGRRYIQDPVAGDLVAYAGAEAVVQRIRVLGAVGIGGPALRAEMDALADAWRAAGYDARVQQLLRDDATLRISMGLVADTAALDSWRETATLRHPLWSALTTAVAGTTPDDRRAWLARARSAEARGMRPATRTFLLGAAAGRLGFPAEAVRHYALLDSLPHRVDTFDAGWGLQAQSYLLRAAAYERLGDGDAALQMLRSFIAARSWPDSLALAGVERARADVDRLSAGGP